MLEYLLGHRLEFKINSISRRIVCNSSYDSLLLPTGFFRLLFTVETSLSQNPPYHGALSGLNFHSTFLALTKDWVSSAIEQGPLSDNTVTGQPRRLIKRLKLFMNTLASALCTKSKTTPLVDTRIEYHVTFKHLPFILMVNIFAK